MILTIDRISTHPLLQGRIHYNTNTIKDYIAHWEAGVIFPPVQIISEGDHNWLADGYHRYESLKQATLETPVDDRQLIAEITPGTMADAIAIACGANAAHGLRRTNDDKIRQLIIYYSYAPEWARKSKREIATTCHVSHSFVNDWEDQIRTHDRFQLVHRTKLDLQTIDRAKEHITLALHAPIEATRGGKTLTIQRTTPEPEPSELAAKTLQEPILAPLTHIYIQTNAAVPRGTLVTKLQDSLTDPTIASITANGENHLVPLSDLTVLPYQIGDRLQSVSDEVEVTVIGFTVIGIIPTVMIQAIDDNGFKHNGSQEFFGQIPKKKPTEPQVQSVPNPTIPDSKPTLKLIEPVVDFTIYRYTGKRYSYLNNGDEVRIVGQSNQSLDLVIVAKVDNLRDKVEVNLKTLQIKQQNQSINLMLLTVEDLNYLNQQIQLQLKRHDADNR